MINPFSRRDRDITAPLVSLLAVVAISIAVACNAFIDMTSFPITYGWYETLVFLEKHGLQPYKTTEFLLPPVVIVYFRTIELFTHGNFTGDRLFGLLLEIIETGLLFFWLRRFVATSAAALACAMLFVVLTTDPSYVAGDYHQLVQFFITLTLLLLVAPSLYNDTRLSWRSLAAVAAGGATIQLLTLTKQNVGLGVFVGYLVALLCLGGIALTRRSGQLTAKIAAYIASYLLLFVATGAAFLIAFDPHTSPWSRYVSFFLVNSKGSALYVATRFMHDTNNLTTVWPAFWIATLVMLLVIAARYFVQRINKEQFQDSFVKHPLWKKIYSVGIAVLLALAPVYVTIVLFGIIIDLPGVWLWNFWPSILALTCYFLDIFYSVAVALIGRPERSSDQNAFSLVRLLLFGAIILSMSMTAALNIVGLAVCFGYYAAILTNYAVRWARKRGNWQGLAFTALLLVACIYMARVEIDKIDVPYAWWGMQEPPTYASASTADLPYLSGLRMSEDRARMLTSIVSTVERTTNPGDRILAYPDIPVFYMLTNRLPMTKTFIQWFDFSSEQTLLPDFNNVSEHPPKIIIEMSLPQAVYDGHESLVGRSLPQRPFATFLECMVETGAFQETSRFFYNRNNAYAGTYSLRTNTAISAEQINQIAALARQYFAASYVTTGGVSLDGGVVSVPDIQKLADQKSAGFGGIVIMGKSDGMPALLKYLTQKTHIQLLPNDDNFILRTLNRQSDWQAKGRSCQAELRQSLSTL